MKKLNFRNNSIWIYILCFILLCGLSYETNAYIFSLMKNSSIYDIFLFQLDNIDAVAFPLTWVFLLFIYKPIVSLKSNYLGIKSENMSIRQYMKLIGYYASIVITFLIIFIAANLVTYPMASFPVSTFDNSWQASSYIVPSFSSPFTATLLGMVLVYFRFFSFSLLIVLITQYSKKEHIGLIIILVVSFVDRYAYNIFGVVQPLGILPIEHTKITYTPGFMAMELKERFSYFKSFVYWGCIIVILSILLKNVLRLGNRGKSDAKR